MISTRQIKFIAIGFFMSGALLGDMDLGDVDPSRGPRTGIIIEGKDIATITDANLLKRLISGSGWQGSTDALKEIQEAALWQVSRVERFQQLQQRVQQQMKQIGIGAPGQVSAGTMTAAQQYQQAQNLIQQQRLARIRQQQGGAPTQSTTPQTSVGAEVATAAAAQAANASTSAVAQVAGQIAHMAESTATKAASTNKAATHASKSTPANKPAHKPANKPANKPNTNGRHS